MPTLRFLGRSPLRPMQRLALTGWRELFPAMPHESMLDDLLAHVGMDPAEARAFREDPDREEQRIMATLGEAPELTQAIADAGAPTHVIDCAHRFGETVAGVEHPLRLDRCAMDDDGGHFEISYVRDGNGIDVRDGDLFHGGFTLMGDASRGTVTVAPRLVRQVCTNGQRQLTDVHGDACTFTCDATGRARGELDLVIDVGLSRENLHAVAERMQQLQQRRAHDAIEALEREGARVPASARRRVQAVFEDDPDASVYAALNALTQTARDSGSIRERAQLECAAGALVPAFVHQTASAPFSEQI